MAIPEILNSWASNVPFVFECSFHLFKTILIRCMCVHLHVVWTRECKIPGSVLLQEPPVSLYVSLTGTRSYHLRAPLQREAGMIWGSHTFSEPPERSDPVFSLFFFLSLPRQGLFHLEVVSDKLAKCWEGSWLLTSWLGLSRMGITIPSWAGFVPPAICHTYQLFWEHKYVPLQFVKVMSLVLWLDSRESKPI